MLIDFSVDNWGPFVDAAQFSMEETRISAQSALTPERQQAGWASGISSVAALFGGNGSGKSQFLEALMACSTFVREGHVEPSLMNPSAARGRTNEPTKFEVVFVAPGALQEKTGYEYRYALSVLAGDVLEEALFYRLPSGGRERRVFERIRKHDAPTAGFRQFGEYLYRWSTQLRGQKVLTARRTGPAELFLSKMSSEDDTGLEPVLDYFRDSLRFYQASAFESEFATVKQRLRDRSPEYRDRLEKYLMQADLGIAGVMVRKVSEDEVAALRRMFGDLVARLQPGLEETDQEEDMESAVDALVEQQAWGVHFLHHGESGASFPLALEQESRGTRAMLAFASVAIEVLDTGSTMIVDELDSSLHPLQVRQLVSQFQSPASNPKQAQLIFTTHDVSLLVDRAAMPRVLERDQIWLVEKDRSGCSEIFSLADFSPRKGEDLLGRYLQGVYGGVPYPTQVLTQQSA